VHPYENGLVRTTAKAGLTAKQVNLVDEVGQKVIVKEDTLRAARLWRSVKLQQRRPQ